MSLHLLTLGQLKVVKDGQELVLPVQRRVRVALLVYLAIEREVSCRRWGLQTAYLATYLSEEGRLASLQGDIPGAIRAYRHFLAIRNDPDPELRPEVERIRREVARLEIAQAKLRE